MTREPTAWPRTPRSSAFTLVELLVVLGIIAFAAAILVPATRRAPAAAHRNHCSNNLKAIALALRSYESLYHTLPPAYTVDDSGKPLHSWRTLILPFLEERQLYASIDLARPWNDEANAEAFKAKVPVYACPAANAPATHTTYLAVVASNGCFRPGIPRELADITDSQSKTLMIVEVAPSQAVHWMCPKDADEAMIVGINEKAGLAHALGVNMAFVDGHVTFLSANLTADNRRALISIAGNDLPGSGEL